MTSTPFRKYTNKLNGSRILIFGASSGFGFAVAEAAIKNGVELIHSDKLANAVERLSGQYPDILNTNGQDSKPSQKVTRVPCDLADLDTLDVRLEALLNQVTNNGVNKINHIVWTADDAHAIPPLPEMTPDDIFKSIRMRASSSSILAKVVARTSGKFISQCVDASITFTNGASSHRPVRGWPVPAMAGAALEGLVRGLAVDLAPLRVNLVSAGAVESDLLSRLPDSIKTKYAEETLTGRLGRVEDIAEACVQ